MLQEGTKLNGTYILQEQIGFGGGGIVYKAYHERLQKYVVVKQIKDQVKDILESRAEVDILKKISHEYLPQVFDFLEINGEVFTVIDFVPGKSLDKEILEKGRFGQKDVLKWTIQVAKALDYLHKQNPPIIHSDIKPANIMLTPEGSICLIDFNVSLAFEQGMRTSTGVSGGYSPPEQYRNFDSYNSHLKSQQDMKSLESKTMADTGETMTMTDETVLMTEINAQSSPTESLVASVVGYGVDERSDVYSLGATVYHLLTGVKPPRNFEKTVPITDYDIPLSEGFGLIINKMMALNPEDRYQNGNELLYALEHIYELDSEYKKYQKKNRNRKLLISALFVVGIGLTAGGWMMMQKERITKYNRTVEEAGDLIEMASYEGAQRLLKDALGLIPERIDAYEKEVLRLYSMGAYEAAVSYGRDAINNPSYLLQNENDEQLLGDIYYVVGNAYFEQGDYANAINCFEEALKRNAENSLYFRDYAIVLAKTGNIKAAETALDAAIVLGLGEDSIYMVQGEVAFSKGSDEEAVEYLNQSILAAETMDLKRRATILCAQAYKCLGDGYLDYEIALLESAENSFGIDVSMHLSEQLADAYARKAKSDEAWTGEFYAKALDKFSSLYTSGYSTRQMMENIAIIYQQMDQLAEAEEMLLQAVEKYPDDYRTYKRLAFLEADKQQKKANEKRDYMDMRTYFETALKLYETSRQNGDTEMQILETMMRDLCDGGWF